MLFGISTRKLELLLWRERPNSPAYLEDCTIFFIWLNNINNVLKLNKMLPTYVKLPLLQDGTKELASPIQ